MPRFLDVGFVCDRVRDRIRSLIEKIIPQNGNALVALFFEITLTRDT